MLMELTIVIAALGAISAVGFTYFDYQAQQASAEASRQAASHRGESINTVDSNVPTITEANHLTLAESTINHLESDGTINGETDALTNDLSQL